MSIQQKPPYLEGLFRGHQDIRSEGIRLISKQCSSHNRYFPSIFREEYCSSGHQGITVWRILWHFDIQIANDLSSRCKDFWIIPGRGRWLRQLEPSESGQDGWLVRKEAGQIWSVIGFKKSLKFIAMVKHVSRPCFSTYFMYLLILCVERACGGQRKGVWSLPPWCGSWGGQSRQQAPLPTESSC